MTDQEILGNAPEGATHIDNKGTSLFRDKKDGIRSLADIKRIAELEAIIRGRDELINNAVSSRIVELEKSYEELTIATLDAVQCMSSGKCKADLRDAYDNAVEQLKEQGE